MSLVGRTNGAPVFFCFYLLLLLCFLPFTPLLLKLYSKTTSLRGNNRVSPWFLRGKTHKSIGEKKTRAKYYFDLKRFRDFAS